MKPEFIERIIEDFKLVQTNWMGKQTRESDTIAAYFGDSDNIDMYYSIADTYAEVALDEYTDFVTNVFFPLDGSWIGVEVDDPKKEDIENAKRFRSIINKELTDRRFYTYINDMIRKGACYRTSLLEIDDINGLNFNIIENDDIYVSFEKGEGGKRAYARSPKTILEIIEGFDGDIIKELQEEYMSEGEVKQDQLMAYRDIIVCVIPESKFFGTEGKMGNYKYRLVYLLEVDGAFYEVENKKQKGKGWYTFPFLNYSYRGRRSLAEKALPYALNANRYEMQRSERGELENRPPMAVDKRTLMENQFDFGAGGLTGISRDEVVPSTLQVQGQTSIVRDDIQDAHRVIDRVFKVPLIQRTELTAVSNFEASEIMLKAIESTALNCYDIINVANDALKRSCDIIIKYAGNEVDKDLLKSFKEKMVAVGLLTKLEKLKAVKGFGRFMQTAAPYIQAKPSSAQIISGDGTLINLAYAMDLPQVLATEEQVNKEREEAAQRQQQEMGMKQDESGAKLAAAESKLG